MKSIVYLAAIVAQFVCMIVAAAKYGFEAGFLVVIALVCNAIQMALNDNDKE